MSAPVDVLADDFSPTFSTHGHARKTHLAIGESDAACGIQARRPDMMMSRGSHIPLTVEAVADYLDCDADGVCCRHCAAIVRRAALARVGGQA